MTFDSRNRNDTTTNKSQNGWGVNLGISQFTHHEFKPHQFHGLYGSPNEYWEQILMRKSKNMNICALTDEWLVIRQHHYDSYTKKLFTFPFIKRDQL